jgi:malonyl CoA-acyl carrier protein transacylase
MSSSTGALPCNVSVERDSENRSNYAMCAVNPSRISPTFSDAALREVVDSIAIRTASLLEIVNYNVEVRLTFMTVILLDFLCIYRVNNMSVPENSSLCRL